MKSSNTSLRMAFVAAVVAGLLASLVLLGLRGRPPSGGPAAASRATTPAVRTPTSAPAIHAATSDETSWQRRAPVPIEKQVPPWAATPKTVPAPGRGYLAAWKAHPPRPAPETFPILPRPTPPDLSVRPPLDNPGGVNGDRPARALP